MSLYSLPVIIVRASAKLVHKPVVSDLNVFNVLYNLRLFGVISILIFQKSAIHIIMNIYIFTAKEPSDGNVLALCNPLW